MPKKTTTKPKQVSLKANTELGRDFQKIAHENYTTPPRLLDHIIESVKDYVKTEGSLYLPLKIVSARDYERFKEYEAMQESNGPKLSSRKQA